jgi:hypothetical protein
MACSNCDDGMIVTCIDDMCRGTGECFHGDGYSLCPCEIDGEPEDDDYYEPDETEVGR